MRKGSDGKPLKTIPVLACGSVPLNNLTYPRGLLVYAATPASGGICKLPLFPDSHKRKLVSVAGPFTAEMLERLRARAGKLVAAEKLELPLQTALNTVCDDFALVGQAHESYARQATEVNHRFWRRLFRDRVCRSELIYIELEGIVCRLLEKDLFDESAICHQLMFDAALRRRLVESLDGHRGCWQHEKLLRRCSDAAAMPRKNRPDSSPGTMFFWGIDAKGRKVPLCLVENRGAAGADLRGIDDCGQTWSIPFTPSHLARELARGHLLPSIFTSYLLVSIARGIDCIGGYYQASYLPIMREAVTATLLGNPVGTAATGDIARLDPDPYLSGMQAIGLDIDGQLLPAGPLEIIASGGLSAEQYERIGGVTVLQSHIASLYDTLMDVLPLRGEGNPSQDEITRLVYAAVGDKTVTVSMDPMRR